MIFGMRLYLTILQHILQKLILLHHQIPLILLLQKRVLIDDAPEYCDVYQTVRMSDRDKTRILIMPIDEFISKKLSLMFQ